MAEDPQPRRVTLFQGGDRARVRIGESFWEDVKVVPLREGDLEPDAPESAVLLRAGREKAVVRVEGVRYDDADLALARGDGEVPVRVKEVRDRRPEEKAEEAKPAKGDAFWSRVFRKKGGE